MSWYCDIIGQKGFADIYMSMDSSSYTFKQTVLLTYT